MKITELLMEETLPKKSLFSSSEVSGLLKVKPHEIRYWESEFPQIKPQKTKHGQRLYRKEDLILLSAIKHLLHDKKFTVAGALKVLADSELIQNRLSPAPVASPPEELVLAPESDHDLLQDSCSLLPEPDLSFDEQTHEIYQNCAQDLEQTKVAIEPKYVGEMIADALTHQAQQASIPKLSKAEYEKAFAILIASRTELSDLLRSLEKYSPTEFWGEFKGD